MRRKRISVMILDLSMVNLLRLHVTSMTLLALMKNIDLSTMCVFDTWHFRHFDWFTEYSKVFMEFTVPPEDVCRFFRSRYEEICDFSNATRINLSLARSVLFEFSGQNNGSLPRTSGIAVSEI